MRSGSSLENPSIVFQHLNDLPYLRRHAENLMDIVWQKIRLWITSDVPQRPFSTSCNYCG